MGLCGTGSRQCVDTRSPKRMRLESLDRGQVGREQRDGTDSAVITSHCVGLDLTNKRKKKMRRKKKRHLLSKLEVQRAKDFIYSSENEQFSVEKLRTMIEDMTEFLDAIWDVYRSEAKQKGVNVEEDGFRATAVLRCLSSSGEGSWHDLQLLSRAKSVLVLRSKNLAASTIASVENELGYDADVRSFIVRMLKFWMQEMIRKE
ncbi:uncharacterized protein LOC143279716 isoform X2 [Babylonia areolata]|uniref:uncharacterized protein LOC143279716 isoform X2 n=1 Tax=Babylonia areolata TaxID=304850 RepID=UPI003FD591C0